MVKTWSKYTNELPNILFNQMFTCSSCAGQNVASVMDTFRENCPDERSYKDLKERMNNDVCKSLLGRVSVEPKVFVRARSSRLLDSQFHNVCSGLEQMSSNLGNTYMGIGLSR